MVPSSVLSFLRLRFPVSDCGFSPASLSATGVPRSSFSRAMYRFLSRSALLGTNWMPGRGGPMCPQSTKPKVGAASGGDLNHCIEA